MPPCAIAGLLVDLVTGSWHNFKPEQMEVHSTDSGSVYGPVNIEFEPQGINIGREMRSPVDGFNPWSQHPGFLPCLALEFLQQTQIIANSGSGLMEDLVEMIISCSSADNRLKRAPESKTFRRSVISPQLGAVCISCDSCHHKASSISFWFL